MTLVKTDLGFLHIIQRFKIVGRETNNNKGLASAPIQKNIQFLNQGKSVDGLLSNGKTMFITNAEIHVYMLKANITET